MSDTTYDVLDVALKIMIKKPRPLEDRLRDATDMADLGSTLTVAELHQHLVNAGPNDELRTRLRESLIHWDFEDGPDWASDTKPNTTERRRQIYSLLSIGEQFQAFLDETLPHARVGPVIVVTGQYKKWYDEHRQNAHNYYWGAYQTYLRDIRHFSPENLETLDAATCQVVERLADPEQDVPYQAKGLVVGYVQSGKTANFTGVIARALDAGYRLVIVLSGTLNLLRDQTQRRIDMELVGKELIRMHVADEAGERSDYDDDPDWKEKFLSHGDRPSNKGAFDIIRLTGAGGHKGAVGDFQSLKQGISTLEIERHEKTLPLYDPVNLHRAAARIMVVKKNPGRLEKLVADLKKIGPGSLNEVPALIIDDESDQASLNTLHPDKRFLDGERQRRTSINGHLTKLLEILPRAQYVGYTATPFANVFVDPDDNEDLFPKDFIISLPKPSGYMGVSSFQDLEEIEVKNPGNSNEAAHVRGIWTPPGESTEKLLEAIDMFVLTGAVKLYREDHKQPGEFRHHTMLAHESHRQRDHENLAEVMRGLWDNAGYDGGEGCERLEKLYEDDIVPVTAARGCDLLLPRKFQDLSLYLGACLFKIDEEGSPITVVNGAKDAGTPNFDKVPVWKILIGGAKLSRGYTVEGLTISYFRRRATYQDSLMQMGRWFGFRPGYQDLVRLYIGRHEPLSTSKPRFIDLYEAFGSMCLDEEEFRSQLFRYSTPEDDAEPLTPREVPPLVSNSHPELKPASPNKMFNAVLKSRNFGGEWIERTLCSSEKSDLRHNAEVFAQIIEATDLERGNFVVEEGSISSPAAPGFAGSVDHSSFVKALKQYRWAKPNETTLLGLELEFLEAKNGDPGIDRWILYLPQVASSKCAPWTVGAHEFKTVVRAQFGENGRFKAFSEPRHRLVAEVLTGKRDAALKNAPPGIGSSSRQGVCLLYPSYPNTDAKSGWGDIPLMGIALLPPQNDLPKRAQFTVRDTRHKDLITVEDKTASKVRS